jgi:SHS2 domain-containing protein
MKKKSSDEIPLYREFDHTGDIGIEITAPTRTELFRRAALALGALLVEPSHVANMELRTVEVTADDDIDLLHDLLTELLQLFAADGFIWRGVVVEMRDRGAHLALQGESFDPRRHSSRGEIKAVTYHQMSIENVANEWRARVIFDV